MRKRILIVEDDSDMAELLRVALTRAGHVASVAATGTEALTEARRSPPDLILLDLILPDVNGFSVCETLRRKAATAKVPIIMITALPGELPRLAGVEMGANAYFSKPFEMNELVARVESFFQPPPLCAGTALSSSRGLAVRL
jgi:DNA-binding response OmpR family regulator